MHPSALATAGPVPLQKQSYSLQFPLLAVTLRPLPAGEPGGGLLRFLARSADRLAAG